MPRDDELVRELAARMHRADRAPTAPSGARAPQGDEPGSSARGGDRPTGDDELVPLQVDLATYEAAHEASQWADGGPPPARRRRTR